MNMSLEFRQVASWFSEHEGFHMHCMSHGGHGGVWGGGVGGRQGVDKGTETLRHSVDLKPSRNTAEYCYVVRTKNNRTSLNWDQ